MPSPRAPRAVRPRTATRAGRRSTAGTSLRRVLVDTHTLLWWLSDDELLSARAREVLRDPTTTVYVSAATAWEISTKHRLGKLPAHGGVATALAAHVTAQGFTPLDVTLDHGLRAGALPGPHKDPFDRMLIAQAQAERLPLVSNETPFDSYGVVRIW
jgi:PIN domain nuclease of toxin-antitoxin system